MDRNTSFPDSDESARNKHAPDIEEQITDDLEEGADLQTSHKTGKHSSAMKLSASRPELKRGRGAVPVDGAHGSDDEGVDLSREDHE
jgi:hypothetical protein